MYQPYMHATLWVNSLPVGGPAAKRKARSEGGWTQPFYVCSIVGDNLHGYYLYNKHIMDVADLRLLQEHDYFIAPDEEVVHAECIIKENAETQILYPQEVHSLLGDSDLPSTLNGIA